ncbi:MAG: hypothetical protein WHS82_00840 [Candidatus Methanosuratincola sp.]
MSGQRGFAREVLFQTDAKLNGTAGSNLHCTAGYQGRPGRVSGLCRVDLHLRQPSVKSKKFSGGDIPEILREAGPDPTTEELKDFLASWHYFTSNSETCT